MSFSGWHASRRRRGTGIAPVGACLLALTVGAALMLAGCSSGVTVEASTEDSDLFHERPQAAPGGRADAPANLVRPRVVSAVAPVLPDGYVVTQEQFIMVEVLVDERGGVSQARLLQPAGEEALDQAALAAARQYRFTAGTVDGIAEPTWTSVPFRFRPDGAHRP
jgi:TonB family protein